MKNLAIIIVCLSVYSCKAQEMDRYPFENKKEIPIEEIQKAISYNLDKAKYYDFKSISIPNRYLKPDYFTETHRQRIVEILEGKWKNDELETHINASLVSVLDTLNPRNGLYIDAKKIAKKKDLQVKKVWDSILRKEKKETLTEISKTIIIPISMIEIAGFLKDQRFVPYLERISKMKQSSLSNAASLALARYRIEPYHTDMVNKYKYRDDYFKGILELSCICSKKAIDEILKYAEDNIARSGSVHDPDTKFYIAESAIYSLSSLYKNDDMLKELNELLRKEFKLEEDWSFPKTIEDLGKMRKIADKYFLNYSMKDIDCSKVTINIGW